MFENLLETAGKITAMLNEIYQILETENLTPSEQWDFLKMQDYLQTSLEDMRLEAYRRVERDMEPIVGEIKKYSPSVKTKPQYGGVMTYGMDQPETTIRKFAPNITMGFGRGLLQSPPSRRPDYGWPKRSVL
jgi:hypothetical protein